MADLTHRTRWLLNAEDAVGTDTDKQIAWLRDKRAEYAELVNAGDWATTDAAGEAGSSKSTRGVSDQVNHDAIVAALRFLGATDLGAQSAMLNPQFGGILG